MKRFRKANRSGTSYSYIQKIRGHMDPKFQALARGINRRLNPVSARTRNCGCLLFLAGGTLLCLCLLTGKCSSPIYPAAGMRTLRLAPMFPAPRDSANTLHKQLNKQVIDSRDTFKTKTHAYPKTKSPITPKR